MKHVHRGRWVAHYQMDVEFRMKLVTFPRFSQNAQSILFIPLLFSFSFYYLRSLFITDGFSGNRPNPRRWPGFMSDALSRCRPLSNFYLVLWSEPSQWQKKPWSPISPPNGPGKPVFMSHFHQFIFFLYLLYFMCFDKLFDNDKKPFF